MRVSVALLLAGAVLSCNLQAQAEPLEATMKQMGGALRELKKQVDDPSQNAASLEAVTKLETATIQAKVEFPDSVKTDADKKAYQLEILKLLQAELKVDHDLLAGQNSAAAADLNAVVAVMKEGHGQFRAND